MDCDMHLNLYAHRRKVQLFTVIYWRYWYYIYIIYSPHSERWHWFCLPLFRWCGPCKVLGPRLEKAVGKHKGRVAMAKVDIDDHTDLAIKYKVNIVWFVILYGTCSHVTYRA